MVILLFVRLLFMQVTRIDKKQKLGHSNPEYEITSGAEETGMNWSNNRLPETPYLYS